MTEQDQKLWDEVNKDPAAALKLMRNSIEFFASGAVEPRSEDIPTLDRMLVAQGQKPITEPQTTWRLIVISGFEDEIETVAAGDIDSMLHEDGPILNGITQGDRDMAANIITDLSRVGARYSEFIGGVVVLAAMDS